MYGSIKLTEKLPSNFLDSVKLVLIQSRVFGLVTFSQHDLYPLKIHIFINVLAVFVYLPAIFYSVYETALVDGPVIYKATDIIILLGNGIYVVTIWTCSIINREKFIEFLRKLIEFDVKLQTMGLRMNYKKTQKKIITKFVIRYVIIIGNISGLIYLAMTKNSDMIVETMAYLLIIINSATCHLTSTLVLMLKTRFIILNKQLNTLIEYFLKKNTKTIKCVEQLITFNKICALHHHLSKLIHLYNEIFGFVLLLMFAISFVIIVISIFYVSASFQYTEIFFTDIVDPLLSNVTFVLNIIYVCDVCYSTIEEVTKTGELIHKIDTEDPDMRDAIEMFSLQIANEDVEFNAAGFFPINYTLIFSILGGVTTYIIILIQLAASVAE